MLICVKSSVLFFRIVKLVLCYLCSLALAGPHTHISREAISHMSIGARMHQTQMAVMADTKLALHSTWPTTTLMASDLHRNNKT